ncbi:hypothetical protein [Prescottella equi]|uniref:hypothetical protein n=1 Tax=Rhodococcus hoagii TaxID=43767 RepID=UPI00197D388C|nr:hypothetical protein [Prescottella equi]NKU91721.1 hypothetical protein [Prescottella equi]NKU95776.1 hypothetical protein [Prescottella equi]NKU95793.1 hypothetical protein [Prescottella equi]
MTNETLAEISRQTRDRLAVKANNRIGQLADLLAGTPEAAHIIGSLRSIVEMLRDTNSDDVQLGLRGMANLFDLHALELAAMDDYEGATLVIQCAEALHRRQQQIDESEFREPSVDRGSIR